MPCTSSFGVLYCDTLTDLYESAADFASTAVVKVGSILQWSKVPAQVGNVVVCFYSHWGPIWGGLFYNMG